MQTEIKMTFFQRLKFKLAFFRLNVFGYRFVKSENAFNKARKKLWANVEKTFKDQITGPSRVHYDFKTGKMFFTPQVVMPQNMDVVHEIVNSLKGVCFCGKCKSEQPTIH